MKHTPEEIWSECICQKGANSKSACIQAMGEYATQQVIGFSEFLAVYCRDVDSVHWSYKGTVYATADLYKVFMNDTTASKTSVSASIITSLGLDVEGYDDATIAFKLDGLNCDIEVDEVFEGMNEQDVRNICTMYSCCGDVLNKDNMMCPTCKEHC